MLEPAFTFRPNPVPLFARTGGPYISFDTALRVALGEAQGPVLSAFEGFLTDADITRWATGARTYAVAPDREMYLIVLQTRYIPQRLGPGPAPACAWLGVAVDATDGLRRSVHCGPETWPPVLPIELQPVPLPAGLPKGLIP